MTTSEMADFYAFCLFNKKWIIYFEIGLGRDWHRGKHSTTILRRYNLYKKTYYYEMLAWTNYKSQSVSLSPDRANAEVGLVNIRDLWSNAPSMRHWDRMWLECRGAEAFLLCWSAINMGSWMRSYYRSFRPKSRAKANLNGIWLRDYNIIVRMGIAITVQSEKDNAGVSG